MNIQTKEEFLQVYKASTSDQLKEQELDQDVLEIISGVRKDGDEALYRYTNKFDHVVLDSLIVSEEELLEAKKQVDAGFLDALKQAKENIEAFHKEQKEQSWFVNKAPGILLGQKVTPIEKVGVYVPGGKAAYPSTVLMDVIPAKIAGVEKIVLTTPPQANGKINPHVLVAAQLVGVDTIYKVGGAQAIAALAYGTETIEKVAKIVGPGNAFVARAKKWVYGDVAIDMIAGPSEICIVADQTAPPSFVAADLLSQAEHDELASSICITTSEALAEQILAEVEKQTNVLERSEIITQSLKQNGKIIVTANLKEAFSVVNEIAPEHLQLMIEKPYDSLSNIKNAGAIFLGNYSPEPLGDYFAGPNHTLPTNGTAKFASPLGVYDFMKKSSIISYSEEALLQATDSIIKIATVEGLTAHANSIQIRKDDPNA
ncbi:histidinol dehydrogenase [Oceanobacillus profundus]|uniref:Histidinol dehydrogenase n=1 Tax=Oceanobacillus profundus TaxID=372463 RepID=A0A417YEF2_9BACI|nr:histidinol dehydrogenase [Oceanobacillus profundus]MBR3118462.1 histidinol dehydrogenase [Oceanobacillus sp.]MDO6450649.1 histidinol dehydrogenase [Oceanobacillus profundus]PAE28493.1 histidinol dehydrogenase [Paenibacillus sp. 7884-2]RHW31038.1 histidinol dehydrogenase [Oceanobacillus profundus]